MAKPSLKAIVTLVVEFETARPLKKHIKAAFEGMFTPLEEGGAALWVDSPIAGTDDSTVHKAVKVRVRDVDLP